MTNTTIRKALFVAGITASLGIGIVGCDNSVDESSRQAGASEEISDTAITTGVEAKLATDRNLDSFDINVTTDNGTVTLTGTVNDTAASTAAETATRSVAGVTKVNNRLNVSGSGMSSSTSNLGDASRDLGDASRDMGDAARNTGAAMGEAGDNAAQAVSDTWITTKVKSVLLADSEAQGLDISVDTQDGVVTLEGEVSSQAAIEHIEALARDVEGVKRVNFSALTVARR